MFEKTVCYVSRTDDGHGYIFSIRRGKETVVEGVTYDNYDGLKKIVKRLSHRRIKKFIVLD